MRQGNTQQFIKRSKKVHGDKYDYSKVNYANSRHRVIIICPIHGEFEQTPERHLNSKGCRQCSNTEKRSTKQYIQLCKNNFGDLYDYSLVNYTINRNKVKIKCNKHNYIFEQSANNHLLGHKGCKFCITEVLQNKCRSNTEEFIQKAKKIHGDLYDYSKVEYEKAHGKVKIICSKHGEFKQIVNDHLCGSKCPSCQCNVSQAENSIFEQFKSFFNKNNRSILNGLELDFLSKDKKLAIECNGNYWHSELRGKDQKYHLNKTEKCEEKGIQLLHILESEWIQKSDIWKSIIYSKLGLNKRIYARKCEIREVENKEKNNFLNENHLQGEDKSSVKLGLYYDNTLVSLMTFIKSRFNKNYEWEISRFVSKIGYSIIGGASKLLSYFKKNYNPISIITYADRRYSNGNLYKQLGFTFLRYSTPNYIYFYNKNCLITYSRIKFQKHKLKDKLQIFDESLTEWENMQVNGYDRIWDCGNSVWVWNK